MNCQITGFKTVDAYARGGTANFIGTGNDVFITSPLGTQFTSNGFDCIVLNGNGGNDTADMYGGLNRTFNGFTVR